MFSRFKSFLQTTKLGRVPFVLFNVAVIGFFVSVTYLIDGAPTLLKEAVVLPVFLTILATAIFRLNDAGDTTPVSNAIMMSVLLCLYDMNADWAKSSPTTTVHVFLGLVAAGIVLWLGVLAALPPKGRVAEAQATA